MARRCSQRQAAAKAAETMADMQDHDCGDDKDDSEDVVVEDDMEEEMLEVDGSDADQKKPAKRKGATTAAVRSSKKKKTSKKAKKNCQASTVSSTPMPQLDFYVINNIMAMLLPAEILQFASTSHQIMDMLTHDHVMRAAIVAETVGSREITKFPNYQEFRDKTALQVFMEVIDDQNVFIPTPMRLLRLMCGQRCEHCLEKKAHVSPSLLMCVCYSCAREKAVFRVCNSAHRPPLYFDSRDYKSWEDKTEKEKDKQVYVLNPYVAKQVRLCEYLVLNVPFNDRLGNRCGPAVSMYELEALLRTGQDFADHRQAIANVPGYPVKEATDSLRRTYEEAKARYKKLQEDIDLKKLIKKQEREERASVVVANRKEIIEKVLALVNGNRKRCLTHHFVSASPKFQNKEVHKLMQPLMKSHATAKSNNKKIEQVAEAINLVQIDFSWQWR